MKLALINPSPTIHVAGETGDIATIQGLEWIFQNIVVSVFSLAGIVLFVMLVIGGFKYLTSGGNPENVASAQKVLTYAVIGLVLIALSYLILVLIKTITGANVTVFDIYR